MPKMDGLNKSKDKRTWGESNITTKEAFDSIELVRAIKANKPRKSTGPHFMEAGQQTRQVYRRVFNGILDSIEIPHQ